MGSWSGGEVKNLEAEELNELKVYMNVDGHSFMRSLGR